MKYVANNLTYSEDGSISIVGRWPNPTPIVLMVFVSMPILGGVRALGNIFHSEVLKWIVAALQVILGRWTSVNQSITIAAQFDDTTSMFVFQEAHERFTCMKYEASTRTHSADGSISIVGRWRNTGLIPLILILMGGSYPGLPSWAQWLFVGIQLLGLGIVFVIFFKGPRRGVVFDLAKQSLRVFHSGIGKEKQDWELPLRELTSLEVVSSPAKNGVSERVLVVERGRERMPLLVLQSTYQMSQLAPELESARQFLHKAGLP